MLEEVKKSNLRGLRGRRVLRGGEVGLRAPGGKTPGPRFVVANADESEPGC